MKNKKIFTLLALASTLLLSSCNDNTVYSRPTNETKDQVLINNTNVAHNTVEWLYDALHDSSNSSEKVQEAVFKVLEEGIFGAYSVNENGDVIIAGYDGEGESKQLEFIKSHKAFWDKAKKGDSNKYDYVEPTSLTDTIKVRVNLFKNLVKKQIVINLFEKANVESNKYRNYFYESKFARSLASDFYKISGVKDLYNTKHDEESSTIFTNKVILDNSVTKEDITTIIGTNNTFKKPVLHLGLYSDYINKAIIPTVMQNLLIEQYIYDNQYTTISRTQSRKIKYISLTTETKNVSDARRLINTFVEEYVNKSQKDKEINYDILANAWKGIYQDLFDEEGKPINESGKLLVNSGFSLGVPTKDGNKIVKFADGEKHPYYKNTKYGDLIEDFAKITLSPSTTDSSTESTFTSSGSYSIETGLEIKTNDIRITDYTTSDWGTKDGGFSSLPSEVKTRLFDYTVMTDFNSPTNIDKNSYLKEINGHYFLKRSISQTDDATDSIVIKDSSSFYLIEVLEAPSQAKLTIGGENAYENTAANGLKQEEISRTIGYTIASGSTYKTAAFTHYLEDCEIIYHDQSIYDYFKSNYSDLFKNN
jgi:hypothetical protein